MSEQGRTSIANSVVAKIAGLAAREIDGVHQLVESGAGAAITGLAQRVTGTAAVDRGVAVEVGQREAAVDLKMITVYGASIPDERLGNGNVRRQERMPINGEQLCHRVLLQNDNGGMSTICGDQLGDIFQIAADSVPCVSSPMSTAPRITAPALIASAGAGMSRAYQKD